MLQPMGGLPYATTVDQSTSQTQSASTSQTASANSQTTSATSSDFATQLEDAIQEVIAQSGNGSQFEINIQTGQGVNSNQYTITVTEDSGSSSSSSSGAAASSTGSSLSSSSGSSSTGSTGSSTSASTPASTSASTSLSTWTPPTFTAAQLATMSPADAYWAQQPSAVQQLRYMPMDERGGYAEELAAEGYTIDVPIMVDDEDPLAVMIQRLEDGYTWVPSALQPNIPAGPGMDVPGATPYDPNNPPAGSIIVSTAFAQGTNLSLDPVVSAQDATTFVTDQSPAWTTS